ncbi:unnamed protein product [Amaranthus hypochondriacus]
MEDQSQIEVISPDDLTQSQSLISPELASAFDITQEEILHVFDVNQKMRASCSTICPNEQFYYPCDFRGGSLDISSNEDMDGKKKQQATKKHRLAWTPELHKKFVESIEQLGSNAVPTTILQHMNVEGLTRENVASHLQKYRSHLKNSKKEKKSDEGCLKDPSEVKSMGMEHDYGQSHQHSMQYVSVPLMVPPLGPYGYGHMGMRMTMSMSMPMPMSMPMSTSMSMPMPTPTPTPTPMPMPMPMPMALPPPLGYYDRV